MAAQSSEPTKTLTPASQTRTFNQDARRRLVLDMKLKGHKQKAIAKHLGVSGKTVARDLKHLQQEPPDEDELDSLCQTITSHLAEIENRARRIFNDATQSANAQIQALEVFRKVQADRVRLGKEVGLLGERTKQIQVTHARSTLDWSPEMRERAARALIAVTLTTELQEPIPEVDCIDVEPALSSKDSV